MKTTLYRLQMKKTLLAAGIILSGLVYSQVGVNNQTPSTTFDVRAKRDASGNITDNTQTIGMQAPRVTRTELTANTATYGSNQNGALIYITDISGGNANAGTQRENITNVGYYYFDAAAASGAGRWVKMAEGNGGNAYTANNGLTMSGTNVKLGGTLTENTDVVTAGNTMSFSGTGNVGVGTKTPISHLSVSNDGGGSGSIDDISIFSYGTSFSPSFISMTSRGSEATPANLNSGDVLGGFIFGGRWNNQWNYTASGVLADYLGGSNTNLRFVTSFNEKMRIGPTGKVGIGTATPNDSSILDLTSSNAGFLMPRLTTTDMNNITSPAGGLQVYNTDEKCTFLYNGTNWRSLCARTFQQSSAGNTQVTRGSSVDLTQSIMLAGTQNVTVQASFNPMTYTNGSNNYALGSYDILIDGTAVTNGMRYSTQNAGNNLYRYSAVATWTTTLAPGSHTIIFRVTSDVAANGATVDTNAEDRRMIVTVN